MRPGIDLSQAVDAHFRLNLGGIEPGVSEHLLNEAYVRAVLMHMSGATVPEKVTGTLLADLRGLDRTRDPVAQIVRVEAR